MRLSSRRRALLPCALAVALWVLLLLPIASPPAARAQNRFLDFDGVDDYVTLGGSISPGANFTIEAWVYPRSFASLQEVVSKTNGTDRPGDIQIRIESGGHVKLHLWDGAGFWAFFLTTGALRLNAWNHTAFTADGTRLRFYFDGVQDPTTAVIHAPVGTSDSPVWIGSWLPPNALFDGLIDDVRIWDHARSASGIMNDMFMELSGSEPGLLAYYTFNQGTCGGSNPSEVTLTDHSSNGVDGTLVNFALNGCASNWVCGGVTCGLPDNGVAVCGDSVIGVGEECDDGNLVDGDGCDSNCTTTGCGNGIVTGGEECDDGNLVDGDGCDTNCTTTGCGNSVVTAGEECDDGNTDPTDGCTDACTICGNGATTVPEECDDGGLAAGDGCDAACQTEPCFDCAGEPSLCTFVASCVKCQRTIAKETSKFVKAKTKALQKCEEGKVKGEHSDPCPNELGAPGTPGRQAWDKIAKASAKLSAKIDKACGGDNKACDGVGPDEIGGGNAGFPDVCPNFENGTCTNAIGGGGDCSGIYACLECIGEAAVDQAIDLYYMSLAASEFGTGSDVNKCQKAIGKEAAKFLLAKEKALAKCWDGRLKGKHLNVCPVPGDGKTGPAILKAESKKIEKICKACGGADKQCDGTVTGPNGTTIIGSGGSDDLTPAAIGFPASCYAVTVPAGGPSCIGDGSVDTLAELVECVDCVSEFKVDCIDAARIPSLASYPPECNGATPTVTVTPTLTATPTPTATATPALTPTATPTP
jgi:cysteine-rich repeat protein